jgi:hypothetical protein
MMYKYFLSKLGDSIYQELNLTRDSCSGMEVVSCENLNSLLTLTITIGGQDFQFRGEDYVTKMEVDRCASQGRQCVPMIEVIPDS